MELRAMRDTRNKRVFISSILHIVLFSLIQLSAVNSKAIESSKVSRDINKIDLGFMGSQFTYAPNLPFTDRRIEYLFGFWGHNLILKPSNLFLNVGFGYRALANRTGTSFWTIGTLGSYRYNFVNLRNHRDTYSLIVPSAFLEYRDKRWGAVTKLSASRFKSNKLNSIDLHLDLPLLFDNLLKLELKTGITDIFDTKRTQYNIFTIDIAHIVSNLIKFNLTQYLQFKYSFRIGIAEQGEERATRDLFYIVDRKSVV